MQLSKSHGAMQLNYGVVGVVVFVVAFAAYLYATTATSSVAAGTTTATGQAVTATSGTFNIPSNAVVVDMPSFGGYEYSQYTPAQVTVIIGVNNTVVWTNHDTLVHNAIATSGLFNSGDIAPGGAYEFTFTTPGTYTYHCSYHPSMSGVVVVKGS